MINMKGHEIICICKGIITVIERDIQIQFLAHFDRELRLIVFLQSTVVVDERPCWIYHQILRQIVNWIGQACRECKFYAELMPSLAI